MADSVLAGDLTLEFGALCIALIHNDLDLGNELLLGHRVGAAVDMQVAVAGVTKVTDVDTLLCADFADVDEELSDPVDRNDNVQLVDELGVCLDSGQEGAARCPDVLLQTRGIDDQNVHGADFLCDLCQLLHLEIKLVFAAADEGDQDAGADRLAVHLSGEHGVSGERGGTLDYIGIHELDGLRIKVSKLDGRNGCDSVGEFCEGQNQGDIAGGGGNELQGQLGDDTESTLRAADQVQQAVTGAGLADGLAELHDLAAGEDNGHSHDIVTGDAVLDSAHAARVGADIAAYGSGLLTGIGGIEQAVSGGIGSQIAESDTDLGMYAEVLHIVAEDLVHAGSADDNAADKGNGAADESGTGTTRGDGDAVLVAELHDSCNFLGAFDLAYSLGESLAVNGHFIVAIVFRDIAVEVESAFADYSFKLLDDFGSNLIVFCHVNFSFSKYINLIEYLFYISQL